MKPQQLLLLFALGGLSFGAWFVLTGSFNQTQPQVSPSLALIDYAPIDSTSSQTDKLKQAEPTKQEETKAEAKKVEPKKDGTTTTTAKPKRHSHIIQTITAPTGAMKDEVAGSIESFKYCTISPNGTRLLTVSERSLICWDVLSGKQLQTYKHGNRWQATYYPSPDAQTVVFVDTTKKEVVIHKAQNGATIGTYPLSAANQSKIPNMMMTFTANGDEFIFAEEIMESIFSYVYTYHAVSTRTGKGRILAERVAIRKGKDALEQERLYASGNNWLMVQTRLEDGNKPPQKLYVINLANKQVQPIKALAGNDIYTHFPGEKVQLSRDGKRILTQLTSYQTMLWAWPTFKEEYTFPSAGQYRYRHNPIFTPDGKRVLLVNAWDRNWTIISWGPGSGGIKPQGDDYLELHDLQTKKTLASVTAEWIHQDPKSSMCRHMAMSGDGKSIALMHSDKVRIIDFQTTLDVAPLPVDSKK